MTYNFHRQWLAKKFHEIQTRTLKALEQLDDEQVNWRPNENSHSISTLIRHIEGNMQERIKRGILSMNIQRDRKAELTHRDVSKEELVDKVTDTFAFIIDTLNGLSDEKFEQTQVVRKKERTNVDVLHVCATHYSEHMGQIFYIAKQCLNDKYQSTSL